MVTYGEMLIAQADDMRMERRTLHDVREALTKAKARSADKALAKLMLAHGRLTDEARAFVEAWK